MTIFNSYVKLPEGIWSYMHRCKLSLFLNRFGGLPKMFIFQPEFHWKLPNMTNTDTPAHVCNGHWSLGFCGSKEPSPILCQVWTCCTQIISTNVCVLDTLISFPQSLCLRIVHLQQKVKLWMAGTWGAWEIRFGRLSFFPRRGFRDNQIHFFWTHNFLVNRGWWGM